MSLLPRRGPARPPPGWKDSWARLLSPALRSMLLLNDSYTLYQANTHVFFFLDTVSPWIGRRSGSAHSDEYPSTTITTTNSPLTIQRVPMTISSLWRVGDDGPPVIRYTIDFASVGDRLSSLDLAKNAIESLRRFDSNFVIQFSDAFRAIAQWFWGVEEAVHQKEECGSCSPSSTFLHVELVANTAALGFTWLFPACVAPSLNLFALDNVWKACWGAFGSQKFVRVWKRLQRYIALYQSVLNVDALSVDTAYEPCPQVLIRVRCLLSQVRPDFRNAVKIHLSACEVARRPSDFFKICEDLYDALIGPLDAWPQKPRYCYITYAIITPNGTASPSTATRPCEVASRFYIPSTSVLKGSDDYIAAAVLRISPCIAEARELRFFVERGEGTDYIQGVGVGRSCISRGEAPEVEVRFCPRDRPGKEGSSGEPMVM